MTDKKGRRAVATERAPKAIGPYSQALRAGDWLFCSGQIPLDPASGEIVAGGFDAQARRVFANLQAVLKAEGADFDDAVKLTIYLADLADFGVLNGIYAEYFREPFPARATIQAAALPKGALVEIDLIAYLPDR